MSLPLAISATRVLITAVEEGFPGHWGSTPGKHDRSAIDGKQLVYNAFNGCTDDFYDAIKKACRRDWQGAHRLFDLIDEERVDQRAVALDLRYNSVTWYVTLKRGGHTINSPQIENGPKALALVALRWHLAMMQEEYDGTS